MADAPAPAVPASQESFAKRHPRLVVFGGLLGVVALIAIIITVRVRSISAERWAAFEADRARKIAQLKVSEIRRAALLGPARPGNAWDEYKPALEALSNEAKSLSSADRDAIHDAMKPAPKEGAAAAAAKLVPGRQVLLDLFRQAARCDGAMYPTDWTRGLEHEIPKLVDSALAGNLLVLSARGRREAGDIPAAIDDVAAGLQFGLDHMRPPILIATMVGVALIRTQATELGRIAADPRTPPAELERIARFMAAVDRDLPTAARTLEVDHIMLNESMRSLGNGKGPGSGMDELGATIVQGWKYGFSIRLMIVDVCAAQEALLEEMRREEGQDHVSAITAGEAFFEKAQGGGNPLVGITFPNSMGVGRAIREARGRLRLVRAAVMVRQGRGPSDPEWPVDPFHLKPVGHKVDGETVRIWSVWHDCKDGTAGSWTPNTEKFEDLVLELKK